MYSEFHKKLVENMIDDCLPEGFEKVSVKGDKVNEMEKEGYLIRRQGANGGAAIWLDDIYATEEVDEVRQVVEKSVTVAVESLQNRFPVLGDKCQEAMKAPEGRIFLQLVSARWNEHYCTGYPHRLVGDLLVIYRLLVEKSEYGISSVAITDGLADMFGFSEEQLYEMAMKNTPELFPVRECSMLEIMYEMNPVEAEQIEAESKDMIMHVVSNTEGNMGAASILYPGVLRGIAERYDADLILLPSSLHEWIVVPWFFGADVQALSAMIKEVNAGVVDPTEWLSDEPYVYRKEGDEFGTFLDTNSRWNTAVRH